MFPMPTAPVRCRRLLLRCSLSSTDSDSERPPAAALSSCVSIRQGERPEQLGEPGPEAARGRGRCPTSHPSSWLGETVFRKSSVSFMLPQDRSVIVST